MNTALSQKETQVKGNSLETKNRGAGRNKRTRHHLLVVSPLYNWSLL